MERFDLQASAAPVKAPTWVYPLPSLNALSPPVLFRMEMKQTEFAFVYICSVIFDNWKCPSSWPLAAHRFPEWMGWDVIGCLLKVDSPEEGRMPCVLLLPVQDRGCEVKQAALRLQTPPWKGLTALLCWLSAWCSALLMEMALGCLCLCLMLCFPWDQHLLTLILFLPRPRNVPSQRPVGLASLGMLLVALSAWSGACWAACVPKESLEGVNTNLWARAEIIFLLCLILPMVTQVRRVSGGFVCKPPGFVCFCFQGLLLCALQCIARVLLEIFGSSQFSHVCLCLGRLCRGWGSFGAAGALSCALSSFCCRCCTTRTERCEGSCRGCACSCRRAGLGQGCLQQVNCSKAQCPPSEQEQSSLWIPVCMAVWGGCLCLSCCCQFWYWAAVGGKKKMGGGEE